MAEARGSLLAAVGGIAAVTLAARAVGFGRWVVFSHEVGAGCVGTVYQSVNAVPNVLYEVAAGGVLSALVVPVVAGAVERGRRAEAGQVVSTLLTWTLLVLVPCALLLFAAAEPVVRALLSTGCDGAVALGADMLRIFAIQVPLYGLAIVLSGVLASFHRFLAAASAPLLSSLVVIATYVGYGRLATDSGQTGVTTGGAATTLLAVGTSCGVLALSLPLLGPVRGLRLRLRPRLRLPEQIGPRLRALALGGLLAVAGQQCAAVASIALANARGGAGVVNVLTYAQAVMLLPVAVLAVPIATATFPALAGGTGPADEGLTQRATALLARSWQATVTVGLLGAALVTAVARPVGAFFARLDASGASTGSAAVLAAMPGALALFAPSVLGLAVVGVLSRAGYIRGHAPLVGVVVGLGWLLGVGVAWTLVYGRDLQGPEVLLALAGGSSVGQLAAAATLVGLTRSWWGVDAVSLSARSLVAVLGGAGVGALVGWWLGDMSADLGNATSLVVPAVLSAASGAACLGCVVLAVAVLDPRGMARLRGSLRARQRTGGSA